MCLMQTDLPVPDGPRIIEILSSGMVRFSPCRILLRPNALCDVDELDRVAAPSPSDRCARVRAPEDLGAEHTD